MMSIYLRCRQNGRYKIRRHRLGGVGGGDGGLDLDLDHRGGGD